MPQAQIQREMILPLFRLPTDYKNLTDKKLLKVDSIDINFRRGKVLFHFNITNAKQDGTKLFGHILIVMNSGAQISFYPDTGISFDQTISSFN